MKDDLIRRKDAVDAVHTYFKSVLAEMPTKESEDGEVIDGDCDELLKHNKSITAKIKELASVIPVPKYIDNVLVAHHYENGMVAMNEECYKRIQPKRGEWIAVDSYSAFGGDESAWMAHGNPTAYYYCSNCKEQAYADEFGKEILSDYCPNCGARMTERSE